MSLARRGGVGAVAAASSSRRSGAAAYGGGSEVSDTDDDGLGGEAGERCGGGEATSNGGDVLILRRGRRRRLRVRPVTAAAAAAAARNTLGRRCRSDRHRGWRVLRRLRRRPLVGGRRRERGRVRRRRTGTARRRGRGSIRPTYKRRGHALGKLALEARSALVLLGGPAALDERGRVNHPLPDVGRDGAEAGRAGRVKLAHFRVRRLDAVVGDAGELRAGRVGVDNEDSAKRFRLAHHIFPECFLL